MLGTCQGFQLLLLLTARDPAVLSKGAFDAEDLELPLQLTPAAARSRMLGGADRLRLDCDLIALTDFSIALTVTVLLASCDCGIVLAVTVLLASCDCCIQLTVAAVLSNCSIELAVSFRQAARRCTQDPHDRARHRKPAYRRHYAEPVQQQRDAPSQTEAAVD